MKQKVIREEEEVKEASENEVAHKPGKKTKKTRTKSAKPKAAGKKKRGATKVAEPVEEHFNTLENDLD